MIERGRGRRVARGGFIASSSVLIAALSHVAGGGANPGVLGVVLSLTFAVPTCVALAGRRLSLARLSVSVALSQFVFHVLFSLGAALPAHSSGGDVGMLGMVMSGGHTAALPTFDGHAGGLGGGSAGAVPMEAMSDVRMWLGHAVAAVLTIVVLQHGDRALVTLRRLASGRLARYVRVADVVATPAGSPRANPPVFAGEQRGRRPLEILLSARPHRGPPLDV